MRFAFLILFLFAVQQTFAQQVVDSTRTVLVRKDARLDILSAKQVEINHHAKVLNTTHARGYRIQVINTQNRDEANNVKAEMLRRFPEHKAYLLYKAPNFTVRVGNFLTQREAEPTRKMIMAMYPGRGIYYVADLVEYKPKDDDDLTGME